MRAFGSDRLQTGKGHQLIIHCPRPKGWVARTPKTYTNPEHPGTAVLWEEAYFEVITEDVSPNTVRYVLEPWKRENVMRITDAYDDASEVRREAEHQAALRRVAARRTANFFGVFTGHLPARVQEGLASNLGIVATRLTALSLILPVLFEIWAMNYIVRAVMVNAPVPMALVGFVMLVGGESFLRLFVVWTQSRPIGSIEGFIIYSIFYGLSPRKLGAIAPIKIEKRTALIGNPAPPDIALQDAYQMREPLVTLLTPAEQAIVVERFGYNYRTSSFLVAWVILGFSLAGVVTSVVSLTNGFRLSALLSLLTAGFLGVEQMRRLSALQRGPAGSSLAFLARPFVRKLLE